MTFTRGDRHDPGLLDDARRLVDERDAAEVVGRIYDLVEQNESWRGQRCINLVAAESPTSPAARALLAAEVGTRASGGHIGRLSRCFAGMGLLDELEALCVELLKKAFRARYADHRTLGGMAGCMVAYAALAEPGDTMMSLPGPIGGDSSGRLDGPGGVRGLRVHDIPFDPNEFTVDLDRFSHEARRHRPKVVSLNQTVCLFPLPVREMKEIISPWGGRLYFDGAHQAGLIAGGCHPNPLDEGADILTGSAGKTFSGPQSGIIAWNDDSLSRPVVQSIFPVLTGSHQINRVAALAVSTAEMLEYGGQYMRQVIANARALAAALAGAGFAVLAANRGYTQTHQVMVDVRGLGRGLDTGIGAAQRLESANIIANKMLLPSDPDGPHAEPSGIRIGTTEVTRLGMRESDMEAIATFFRRVLLDRTAPETVRDDVEAFRREFQTLHYCIPDTRRLRPSGNPIDAGAAPARPERKR